MKLPPIPKPVSTLLSLLPQFPPSVAAAVIVNLWLGKILNTVNLPDAQDKVVCINVNDAGLRLLFRMRRDGVVACRGAQPDLTISANTAEFLALALRKEDADTLFFDRRLCMEGDTELGLLIKNTLDALDTTALNTSIPTPAALLRLLKFSSRGE